MRVRVEVVVVVVVVTVCNGDDGDDCEVVVMVMTVWENGDEIESKGIIVDLAPSGVDIMVMLDWDVM